MAQASETPPSPHCDIIFDTCCGIFECATAGCFKWADTIAELPCPYANGGEPPKVAL